MEKRLGRKLRRENAKRRMSGSSCMNVDRVSFACCGACRMLVRTPVVLNPPGPNEAEKTVQDSKLTPFLSKGYKRTGTTSKCCTAEWTTAPATTEEHVKQFLRADFALESTTAKPIGRECRRCAACGRHAAEARFWVGPMLIIYSSLLRICREGGEIRGPPHYTDGYRPDSTWNAFDTTVD